MGVNWGGIVAGAMGGAGAGVKNLAGGYIEDERKLDVAKGISDMQEQAAARAEDRREAQRRAGNLHDLTEPGLVAAQDAKQKRELGNQADAAVSQAGRVANDAAARQTRLGNDPDALRAMTNIARATHIESQASLMQAALAKLQIGKSEDLMRYQRQLADARTAGQDDKVAEIQQRITDLAFQGKDTAEAYKAYNIATSKMLDLEIKLATADPATATRIQGEIDQHKAVISWALRELGGKPASKAGPGELTAGIVQDFQKAMRDPKVTPAQRAAMVAKVRKDFGEEGYARLANSLPGAASGASGASGGPGLVAGQSYGLLSGPRVDYLETLVASGKITPAEQAELAQLKATKGDAWFRGRASAEDSRAGP